MVSKTGEAESIISHYLYALGAYRGLYILNWIYRYNSEGFYDLIAIIAGIIQTIPYCEFFFFNSAEHVYKKIKRSDTEPSEQTQKGKKSISDTNDGKNIIGDAPMSILERDRIDDRIGKEDIAFKPKLGLVPDFNVPSMLPDLVGIADIEFNQKFSSIAPSSFIDLPEDLPDVGSQTQSNEPSKLTSGEMQVLNNIDATNMQQIQ